VSRALVIAGHGSHLDPRSSLPVHAHAAAIRRCGEFDEVLTAFWKEEPSLSRVLDGVDASDITVVPFFMAQGYFANTVIPREMGLRGPVTCTGGRVIRYTAPVGAHPRIPDAVVEAAKEAGATPAHHLVVLGHGTPADAISSVSAARAAEVISRSQEFRAVSAVYLDEEPSVSTLASLEPPIVAVPLFVAEGWHAGVQLPAATAHAVPAGLTYARPVGLQPAMPRIILDLACEAASWR
jgi:sirohydrochlorin cobaltochelatase